MANKRPHRETIGDEFSEGARLLWVEMDRRAWTQADLRRALDLRPGALTRILYGEYKASLAFATKCSEVLGIDIGKWLLKPAKPFVPPAARAA